MPTHVLAGAIKVKPTASGQRSVALGYAGLVILDRAGCEIVTGLGRPANQELVTRLKQQRTGTITDGRGLDGASGRVVVWASSPLAGWTVALDRSGASSLRPGVR